MHKSTNGDVLSKETLLQINQQQKYLIQILCDAYNSQTEKGKLYDVIRQFCLQQQNAHNIFEKIDSAQAKADATFVDEAGQERIRELEEEIRNQDALYAKLENQLKEYNEQAKEFEEMLAQNEREKADLLASFQKAAGGSQSHNSSAFRDLEVRADELTAECEKLRKQSADAKNICKEVKHELARSHEERKELERQVEAAKRQLSHSMEYTDPEIKQQIEEQEAIIEDLQNQIDEANKEIAALKRENQSLRDRLLNSD